MSKLTAPPAKLPTAKNRQAVDSGHWLAIVAKQFVWLAGSFIVLVVALELVLFWAHAGEQEYLQVDSVVGATHLAGKLITFRSEGYSQERINSAGFRDVEYDLTKPPHTVRIAVLGDSVTEGLQVPLDDSYVKLLEKQLQARSDKKIEVLNFAMSGQGTGQEYVQLMHQVLNYHPDTVILAYQVGDSDDNVLQSGLKEPIPRPYFKLDSNRHLLIDWSVLNDWHTSERAAWFQATDWLRRHSRIWGVLCSLQLSLSSDKTYQAWRRVESSIGAILVNNLPRMEVDPAALSEQKRISAQITQPARPEKQQKSVNPLAGDREFAMYAAAANSNWALAAEIIHQLNQACRTQQCKLVVLGLPAPNNCLFYFHELQELERLAKMDGFVFVNVHEKFPPRAPMQKSPYYFDYHLSGLGHKKVAEIVLPALGLN
jgi:hypothetical protein